MLYTDMFVTQFVVLDGEGRSERAGRQCGLSADCGLVRAVGVPLQQHGQPAPHHHTSLCSSGRPWHPLHHRAGAFELLCVYTRINPVLCVNVNVYVCVHVCVHCKLWFQ